MNTGGKKGKGEAEVVNLRLFLGIYRPNIKDKEVAG